MIDAIETAVAELKRVVGDKPATHARAKDLRALVDTLIRQTQAGPGEFKWTAAARKGLTKPAPGKGKNPTLFVARGDGETWHTDGCYLVKGEPSKRFEPYDTQDLPIGSVHQIIPGGGNVDEYTPVTVLGASETRPDTLELSDGTLLNRLYVTYVLATLGGDVVIASRGGLYPVLFQVNGETLGIVMPLRTV